MTHGTEIPTLEEIEDSKKAMDDIQAFTYSTADSFTDSKGVIRDTVNGRLKKMGYDVPIPYTAGIIFTANDNVKTVEESSTAYAPLPASLPFTTSGTFIGDDDARFFVVQGVTNDQLINDLSQAYEFETVDLMVDSSIVFPLGKSLKINGGAEYIVGNFFGDLKEIPLDTGLFARAVNANTRGDKLSITHNSASLASNHGQMRIAHRNGGYGVANSVYNYQKMLDTGSFDGIEIDMCVSADGVLYNYHDIDVSILTDGTGNFWELNSSYIDTLKFTANIGTVFEDDPIPRLTDIFDLARETGTWLFAEIKFMRGGFGAPQLSDIELMVDLAQSYGLTDKIVFAAFDKTYLTQAVTYNNKLNILRYSSIYSEASVDFTKYIGTQAAIFYALDSSEMTSSRAEYIRNAGLIPTVWTVNSALEQQRFISAGISIILSDNWGI